MRRSRWLAFLASAAAAHALALAVAPRPRAAPPPSPPDAPPALAELEIDLATPPPAPAPPPTPESAPSPSPSPSPAPSPSPSPAPSPSPSPAPTPAPTPSPASALASSASPGSSAAPASPEPPASGAWTFDPTSTGALAPAGAVAQAAHAVGAEGAPVPVGPFAQSLGDALDAQDQDRSTSRGGPVLAALERAAAGAGGDLLGAATFDVGVDTTGHVSIAVTDATPSTSAWQAVADAARAGLPGGAVRVPPGARGWRVVARLEAKLAYPNGADPKKMGNRVASQGFHATETKEAIVIDKLPSVTLSHTGKVCSVGITLGLPPGISGGCDPSNVGAQALRQVHGHIASEGRF